MNQLFLILLGLFALGVHPMPDVPRPVAVSAPGKNVDSPAIWIAPKVEDSLVLLTEKGGGAVMVFKADAKATFVRRFGEFKRPNGVTVLQGVPVGRINKDLAFVTDRGGDVVKVYSIPDFELVGTFAEGLDKPMGISLYHRPEDGALFAYIVPKMGRGNEKVIRYRIEEVEGRITGRREINFGKELLTNQETVMVDADRKLVYVADENRHEIKVYNLDGELQGTFGKGNFSAQVEGIVLTGCGTSGYIIASDQKKVTEIEVFDRSTFQHLGTIKTGLRVTDGLALTERPLPDFPNGLFVAHSDPDGKGGRHIEFYHLDQLLESIGPNPNEKRKNCRP
ncbi:MAG: phytase [Acidobacteriota bacterium]|nr:MAG: phytase [Acidobacteriota bacterium]